MPDSAEPLSKFEQIYLKLGRRFSESLYNEVASAASLQPRPTVAKVLAFSFAGVVHALTIVVAIAGLALIVRGWPNFVFVLAGVLCIAIAWVLRPRVPKLQDEILSRQQFSALYGLTDRIADALGSSPVDGIVVVSPFNAYFGQFGFTRKRILGLGLPMFLICDARERVALLGHEFGHGVNGDSNRSFFISTAVNSLLAWYYLLHPGSVIPVGGGLLEYALIPWNLLQLSIAQLIWLSILALSHLLYRDSQRAEYLADYLAATVSGTEAAQSLMEKFYFDSIYVRTVQYISLTRQDESLFDELKRQVADVSAEEKERLTERKRDEDVRLDATHPPTPYRIQFLGSHRVSQPRVVLTAAESQQIDDELAALHASIRRQILDAHRRSLEVAY